MKKYGWIVLLLVVLAVGGYLGKHQIQALLGMTSQTSQGQTPATQNGVYMIKTDASRGSYLADSKGMTLYTYNKDTKGVSNCTGICAQNWPPYMSGTAAKGALPANITVITRSDGSKQFAWKGMPLYYFVQDSKSGDISGDGVGGFVIVTP